MRTFVQCRSLWPVWLLALAVSACAGNPYQPQVDGLAPLEKRAEEQTEGAIRVRVAVPSPAETESIFALPLYDRGIQPVWIEVVNGGATDLRFAPVGTDPDYRPAMEVAYTHRSGFSSDARTEMEQFLDSNAMPRSIGAGERRSGFVFTAARPGTKGVNIDLIGPGPEETFSFVFFVNVPGFNADHAEVNFEGLYDRSQMTVHDASGLRQALAAMGCCSTDETGARVGDLVNAVMIGKGEEVLHALLRAGWNERISKERTDTAATANQAILFGRPADAVFRRARASTGERNELRLWMAPMRLGDETIWMGDVIQFIVENSVPIGIDPDIDDARDFLLQDLWYSQGLAKFGWVVGGPPAPIDAPRTDVMGSEYFTDGYRIVLWPTGTPVSLLETDFVDWDPSPGR